MKGAAWRLPSLGRRAASVNDDLVRRARQRDRAAFGELVQLHQHPIYRVALRMVGPDAAEDITQRAFIKAWEGIGRFDSRAAFGTWLHRIAINLCLDELRRAARFRPLPLDGVSLNVSEQGDFANDLAEREQLDERRRVLAWALEQLPSEDRLILHLRTGEERPYEEIGAMLGLNVRTVGTRLYRARARLHALIVRRLEEGRDDVR